MRRCCSVPTSLPRPSRLVRLLSRSGCRVPGSRPRVPVQVRTDARSSRIQESVTAKPGGRSWPDPSPGLRAPLRSRTRKPALQLHRYDREVPRRPPRSSSAAPLPSGGAGVCEPLRERRSIRPRSDSWLTRLCLPGRGRSTPGRTPRPEAHRRREEREYYGPSTTPTVHHHRHGRVHHPNVRQDHARRGRGRDCRAHRLRVRTVSPGQACAVFRNSAQSDHRRTDRWARPARSIPCSRFAPVSTTQRHITVLVRTPRSVLNRQNNIHQTEQGPGQVWVRNLVSGLTAFRDRRHDSTSTETR
ncbi:exported protein of unknown function [Agreia sp. COWG]|nr:exported protein of unknown function [Agreia sp. COWG]